MSAKYRCRTLDMLVELIISGEKKKMLYFNDKKVKGNKLLNLIRYMERHPDVSSRFAVTSDVESVTIWYLDRCDEELIELLLSKTPKALS